MQFTQKKDIKKLNVWSPILEAKIAIFCYENYEGEKEIIKEINEMNYKILRKNKTKTNKSLYTATPLQRLLINKK